LERFGERRGYVGSLWDGFVDGWWDEDVGVDLVPDLWRKGEES
jgi:hypothetical protein